MVFGSRGVKYWVLGISGSYWPSVENLGARLPLAPAAWNPSEASCTSTVPDLRYQSSLHIYIYIFVYLPIIYLYLYLEIDVHMFVYTKKTQVSVAAKLAEDEIIPRSPLTATSTSPPRDEPYKYPISEVSDPKYHKLRVPKIIPLMGIWNQKPQILGTWTPGDPLQVTFTEFWEGFEARELIPREPKGPSTRYSRSLVPKHH